MADICRWGKGASDSHSSMRGKGLDGTALRICVPGRPRLAEARDGRSGKGSESMAWGYGCSERWRGTEGPEEREKRSEAKRSRAMLRCVSSGSSTARMRRQLACHPEV